MEALGISPGQAGELFFIAAFQGNPDVNERKESQILRIGFILSNQDSIGLQDESNSPLLQDVQNLEKMSSSDRCLSSADSTLVDLFFLHEL